MRPRSPPPWSECARPSRSHSGGRRRWPSPARCACSTRRRPSGPPAFRSCTPARGGGSFRRTSSRRGTASCRRRACTRARPSRASWGCPAIPPLREGTAVSRGWAAPVGASASPPSRRPRRCPRRLLPARRRPRPCRAGSLHRRRPFRHPPWRRGRLRPRPPGRPRGRQARSPVALPHPASARPPRGSNREPASGARNRRRRRGRGGRGKCAWRPPGAFSGATVGAGLPGVNESAVQTHSTRTMVSSISPFGRRTRTLSPSRFPSSARPSGAS